MTSTCARPRSRVRGLPRPGLPGQRPLTLRSPRPRLPGLLAGRQPRPGRDRVLWVLGCTVATGWALGFPLFSRLATQRLWGVCAATGYAAAALAALLLPRRRIAPVAVGLALAGALLVPLGVLLARGLAQSEVTVVQNAAATLLHSGSPYAPRPRDVTGYDPYLPGMALFGLPHALLGPVPVLGDARPWFLLVFGACLAVAWRLLRAPGAGRRQVTALGALGAVVASPLVALPGAVGGVDLPMIGLCCLAPALAFRGYAGWAGAALAAACALKWTAWPAVPVVLVLLGQVHGVRAVRFCASVTGAGLALLVLPGVLLQPRAVLEQVVRFPLGLAGVPTPAGSPLPGHLLAGLGAGGRTAALVLLALSGLLMAGRLVVRPPRTAVQAADRLAVGMALAFVLAPAGRFGYLLLPAVLLLWPRLAAAGRSPCLPDPDLTGRPALPAGALTSR